MNLHTSVLTNMQVLNARGLKVHDEMFLFEVHLSALLEGLKM